MNTIPFSKDYFYRCGAVLLIFFFVHTNWAWAVNHYQEDFEAGLGGFTLDNSSGLTTVRIYGDYSDTGDGRVVTDELQITGGSDLSEQFDIGSLTGTVEPGMLVCIDAEQVGPLHDEAAGQLRDDRGVHGGHRAAE